MTQPHVFVAMADILHLQCDAWLLPADSRVSIRPYWAKTHPNLQRLAESSGDDFFRSGQAHAAAIHDWDQQSPRPILTTVPNHGQWSPDVVAERLEAFVVAALGALKTPFNHRPYRLLALPFFGTLGRRCRQSPWSSFAGNPRLDFRTGPPVRGGHRARASRSGGLFVGVKAKTRS